MAPMLVILAGGMGSRYGGLKQLDVFGPCGETIIDYSVFDAVSAGFDRIVFVLREEMEIDFAEAFLENGLFRGQVEVDYCFQGIDDLPAGFEQLAVDRKKPWGTAHALRAARKHVNGNFAVINADDFYGRRAYRLMAEHFKRSDAELCMVGYKLGNTLSGHGSVSRGICNINGKKLLNIQEVHGICRNSAGEIIHQDAFQSQLRDDDIVSMNIWGFTPDIFEYIEHLFQNFLQNITSPLIEEFYIPSVVNSVVSSGILSCEVLKLDDSLQSKWFGVTYKQDKPSVCSTIEQLIAAGTYKVNLWGGK